MTPVYMMRKLVNNEPYGNMIKWSGRPDLNRRPLAPHASTLPGCATPRFFC